MAITVVSTTPADGVTGHYTDHSVYVEFSKEIESSYLDSDYFKIYRTNSTHSEYNELLSVTVSKEDEVVEINPTSNMLPESYYMLIVVGGSGGIQSIDSDTLASNHIIYWRTAATVAPTTASPESTPEVDLYIDGDRTDDSYEPSYDMFADSGSNAPIALSATFPADKSVGVDTLSRIIFTYNDDVDTDITVPTNALNGRYSDLPMDLDPFGDRSVNCTGVVVTDNQVIFSMSGITDTENREYTFTLSPSVVRGETRTLYDTRTHVIKFMGPLDPVYATPDQITRRLVAWSAEVDPNVTDYDIWKLILEASIWVRDVYNTEMTSANMIQVNKLTICLVLRELYLRGMLFAGGVRARSLLAVRVDYETPDWESIVQELEKCIRESVPEGATGGITSVAIGVKSSIDLDSIRGEHEKKYGVYR